MVNRAEFQRSRSGHEPKLAIQTKITLKHANRAI